MPIVSTRWLVILAVAAAWTSFFSLFNRPGIRGWRNLGWPACYVLAIIMLFVLPWRIALATWLTMGIAGGLVYFLQELLVYLKTRSSADAARPRLRTLVDGLFLWPIMLPEGVEYGLAELGILRAPPVEAPEPASGSTDRPGDDRV